MALGKVKVNEPMLLAGKHRVSGNEVDIKVTQKIKDLADSGALTILNKGPVRRKESKNAGDNKKLYKDSGKGQSTVRRHSYSNNKSRFGN